MSEDHESRIRRLEAQAIEDKGALKLMEQKHASHAAAMERQLETLVSWTEKKDARTEWVFKAVVGLVIAAVVGWVLAGGLANV